MRDLLSLMLASLMCSGLGRRVQTSNLTAWHQLFGGQRRTRFEVLRDLAKLGAAVQSMRPFENAALAASSGDSKMSYMPQLAGKGYGKTEMSDYSDFTRTATGLLYLDKTSGTGKLPEKGDRVVCDWSGYTIGYFGRPFETNQLRKLDKIDNPFLRFVVGSGEVVPGLDQGVIGMKEGGIRQIVIPPGVGETSLSYPASDPKHERVGPKPSTFSGQRALDFVLENQGLIDKTLLFNVKLIRVDKSDGKGGFVTRRQE